MVIRAFNARTWDAEAGQPALQIKFRDNQGYKEGPCVEIDKQTNKQKLTITVDN